MWMKIIVTSHGIGSIFPMLSGRRLFWATAPKTKPGTQGNNQRFAHSKSSRLHSKSFLFV